jgi:hypothetical protein
MSAMRVLATSIAVAALAVGCGGGDVQTTAQSGERTTLADVKQACEASFSPTSPGRAQVNSELRDANVEVSIDAPCLVTLAPEASVTLNNVTLTGEILNLVDDPESAGVNRIKLQRVTFEGRPGAGFLVELRDAADTLEVEHSELDFPSGIVFRIFGHRDEDNDGGSIRMEHTSLSASGEAEGVVLLTSEHTGAIRLVQTTIDTPADIVLIAKECQALIQGDELDCSAASIAENLERQAEEIESGG